MLFRAKLYTVLVSVFGTSGINPKPDKLLDKPITTSVNLCISIAVL